MPATLGYLKATTNLDLRRPHKPPAEWKFLTVAARPYHSRPGSGWSGFRSLLAIPPPKGTPPGDSPGTGDQQKRMLSIARWGGSGASPNAVARPNFRRNKHEQSSWK